MNIYGSIWYSKCVVRSCKFSHMCRASISNPSAAIITSFTNKKVSRFRSLLGVGKKNKFNSDDLVVLEGHRHVIDAISRGLKPSLCLVSDRALSAPLGETMRALLTEHDIAVDTVEDSILQKLTDSEHSQGVLAAVPRASLPNYITLTQSNTNGENVFASDEAVGNGTSGCKGGTSASDVASMVARSLVSNPLMLVLDGIQDPGNLGTLYRNAYGFGVGCVVTLGGCHPLSPKALRSSMGTVLAPDLLTVALSVQQQRVQQQLHQLGSVIRALGAPTPYQHQAQTQAGAQGHMLMAETTGRTGVHASTRARRCRSVYIFAAVVPGEPGVAHTDLVELGDIQRVVENCEREELVVREGQGEVHHHHSAVSSHSAMDNSMDSRMDRVAGAAAVPGPIMLLVLGSEAEGISSNVKEWMRALGSVSGRSQQEQIPNPGHEDKHGSAETTAVGDAIDDIPARIKVIPVTIPMWKRCSHGHMGGATTSTGSGMGMMDAVAGAGSIKDFSAGGALESLNAANAGAILLCELSRVARLLQQQ